MACRKRFDLQNILSGGIFAGKEPGATWESNTYVDLLVSLHICTNAKVLFTGQVLREVETIHIEPQLRAIRTDFGCTNKYHCRSVKQSTILDSLGIFSFCIGNSMREFSPMFFHTRFSREYFQIIHGLKVDNSRRESR